jgi:DNA polymerase (family X)
MDNVRIALTLSEIADLLEIRGSNPFRIRAYRNAARTVQTHDRALHRMVEAGEDLTTLPGVGKDMAGHITEMVQAGSCALFDELCEEIPRALVTLVKLPGVGPKKAKVLWEVLGIESVDALQEAGEAGRIAGLPGFGAKTEAKILAGIEEHRRFSARHRLVDADRIVHPLLAYLRDAPGLERLEVAGSYRRRRETVGDIDLLAVAADFAPVMERFLAYPGIERELAGGETKGSVMLGGGLQVDLRVMERESYGAALVYFTGSKEHNVRLRSRAQKRGLRLSEYGVFEVADGKGDDPGDAEAGRRVAGETEEEVYAALGLPWVAPELREDRGEVQAAEEGRLPQLVEIGDLVGDLHMHSTWSDGKATIAEMAVACVARGYRYMAITDHSKVLAMTNGLDARRLREQWEEIAEVQEAHPEIRILRGQEVDILADGTLDLEDEMLEALDIVIVSVHSRFRLDRGAQTERVVRALQHPQVNVLAHPTGRLINRREPYDIDLDAVFEAASENGVIVELNSNPHRLDLSDVHLAAARRRGLRIMINSDSHSPDNLDLIRYGVEQARRAWLEPADVVNTLKLDELLSVLAKSA